MQPIDVCNLRLYDDKKFRLKGQITNMKNISIFTAGFLVACIMAWINIEFLFDFKKFSDGEKLYQIEAFNIISESLLEGNSLNDHGFDQNFINVRNESKVQRYYNKRCSKIFKGHCFKISLSKTQFNHLGSEKIKDILLNNCRNPKQKRYSCSSDSLISNTSVLISVYSDSEKKIIG